MYSQQLKKNRANEADYVLDGEDEVEELKEMADTIGGDVDMIATTVITTATKTPSSSSTSDTSSSAVTVADDEHELFKKYFPKPNSVVVRSTSNNKFSNGASASDNIRLATLIERFVESSKTDGKYYICDHANIILISNWLHTIPLTLPERFVMSIACSFLVQFTLSAQSKRFDRNEVCSPVTHWATHINLTSSSSSLLLMSLLSTSFYLLYLNYRGISYLPISTLTGCLLNIIAPLNI